MGNMGAPGGRPSDVRTPKFHAVQGSSASSREDVFEVLTVNARVLAAGIRYDEQTSIVNLDAEQALCPSESAGDGDLSGSCGMPSCGQSAGIEVDHEDWLLFRQMANGTPVAHGQIRIVASNGCVVGELEDGEARPLRLTQKFIVVLDQQDSRVHQGDESARARIEMYRVVVAGREQAILYG